MHDEIFLKTNDNNNNKAERDEFEGYEDYLSVVLPDMVDKKMY